MGELPHYFDIVLFAMIAVFLVLRLRSVLGRRTGNERRREPMMQRVEGAPGDKIVALGTVQAAPPPLATPTSGETVAAGLERIHAADAAFDAAQFLEGARIAFETIVAAFAAGD